MLWSTQHLFSQIFDNFFQLVHIECLRLKSQFQVDIKSNLTLKAPNLMLEAYLLSIPFPFFERYFESSQQLGSSDFIVSIFFIQNNYSNPIFIPWNKKNILQKSIFAVVSFASSQLNIFFLQLVAEVTTTALVKMFVKTEPVCQHAQLMAAHVVRMPSVPAYNIVQSVNVHLVSLVIHKWPVPTSPVRATVNVHPIEPASTRNVSIHALRVRIVWSQLSACHITTRLTVHVLLDSVVTQPLDALKVDYSSCIVDCDIIMLLKHR